jgi:2-methylcitrate dehydratase PrpD
MTPLTSSEKSNEQTPFLRDQLAHFCTRTDLDSLSEDAVRFAKLCWMDQIGLMIASHRTYTDDYPDIASFMKSFGGKEESTIIGTGGKVTCLSATLVNTAIGINDHFDAVHKSTIIHLPAALLPSLLAVAERQKASGADLILATVIGAEVMTRFGIAMGARDTYARGFHPSAVCAPMGCAAGTGKLLGLTERQLAEALSIASVQAAGAAVWAGPVFPATWSFQVARAAEGGVLAALLSQIGFTGVDMIFEADRGFLKAYSTQSDSTKITAGLGKSYEIAEVSFKRIGVGVYLMTCLEAMIEMMAAEEISPDRIEAVTVTLPTVVVPLVGIPGYPEHRSATHLNTRYMLAVTAYRGSDIFYSMAPFARDTREDRRIRELFEKISLAGDPELDKAFPEKKSCVLTIKTKDGRQFTHRNDGPFKGDPANPLTAEDIETKFTRMTVPVLGQVRTDRIIDMIHHLETVADISRLVDLLVV